MRKTGILTILAALAALFTLPQASQACFSPVMTMTAAVRRGPAVGALTNIQLCLPVNIFGITMPTNCACGLGLKGAAPLPASLNFTGATVLDANMAPVGTFTMFTPNAATAATLAAGGAFGTPPVPGATWFGFRGVSTPVTAQPGFVCFIGTVNTMDLDALEGIQVESAGGQADDNFDPVPGAHFNYADNGFATVVPEPGSIALLGAGVFGLGLYGLRLRRRIA